MSNSFRAVLCASALVCCAGSAMGQAFLPVASGSAEDNPRNGIADTLSTTLLIREQSTRENRSMVEYDLTSLAGMSVQSASFSGQIVVNNAQDNGVRSFNIEVYQGDGTITLGDFSATATVIGSTSYRPPIDAQVTFSFDATAAVAALVAGGATHIGVRIDPTSDPNFPNNLVVSGATAATLTIVAGGGGPTCGTADFDGDGDSGTDFDIEAYFACLAGNCCASCFEGGADFNMDGDSGTDSDIEAFFRVLAGGEC